MWLGALDKSSKLVFEYKVALNSVSTLTLYIVHVCLFTYVMSTHVKI